MASDLTPLPPWRQKWNKLRADWRRSKERRRLAYKSFKRAARAALTLAVSVVGAILISFGVWSVYHPAGYVVAGLLLWGIQWNYGKEES